MTTPKKFAQWILELEVLAYEIKYVKGIENGPADFLSRIITDVNWGEEEHFERHIHQIHYGPDWQNNMKICQGEDILVSSMINQIRHTNQVTQGQVGRKKQLIPIDVAMSP